MQPELTPVNNVIPRIWDLTELFGGGKKNPFALKKVPNTNLLPLKSCNQELRVYAGFKASLINDSSNFDVVPIRD